MGGLSPSLKLDLNDPEAAGPFLKMQWDTDDHDHTLEHRDPEVTGEIPPLNQEWEQHPINRQEFPANPDLQGPHPLPP
jgi:hypothetical protein